MSQTVNLITELLEADVLVVGGGIAGMMAAIRASESGASVIVAEKANTLRSGAGSTGNDHFVCYIPEVHGPDIEPVVERNSHIIAKDRARTKEFVRTWLAKSYDIVKLWESWGIPMKYNGKWEFTGGNPGVTNLKYAGQRQKPILTREALKRGVKIINRVTVFDLLTVNGNLAGAMGISSREDKLVVVNAPVVVLTTGVCTRLYPGPTPGWMFNRCDPPTTTGEGRAMAIRAGAELVNIEMLRRWSGARYFARCGRNTWVGVIRDPSEKPVGPFLTRPDRHIPDAIATFNPALFEQHMQSGTGPVYMDCRGLSSEDFEYMIWGLNNEGNSALVNYLHDEGIDIRTNPVEFMTYEPSIKGGILFNEKAETSIKGLFAAGDEYFGGISGAATMGWIAGDNAALSARKNGRIQFEKTNDSVKENKGSLEQIRNRENGAGWQEINMAISQIMSDYAGTVKSEKQLEAGLRHLRRLKQKAQEDMTARNQHELSHCLETWSLFDIGEAVLIASLGRKESRGSFVRADYPQTDPMNDGKIQVYKVNHGQPIIEWRKIQ